MVINFDQTPLSYVTVGNTTVEFFGVQLVPVKGKGKGKRFSITAAGNFLLIYVRNTFVDFLGKKSKYVK